MSGGTPLAAGTEAPTADWSHEPERGNGFWLRVMSWIALRCGRRVARLVLHPITLYFVLFSPKQRRHSRRYLDRVLGRDGNWIDGYRHVYSFASTILDRVYLLSGRLDLFDIRTQGLHLIDAVLAEGRGAFLVGAHFGSFEVLHAVGRTRPEQRVAMVMYPDNARLINTALEALAPGAKPRIIALGRRDSMLAIRDWLDDGGLAGVLADRSLPGRADVQEGGLMRLPFLGVPAPFNDGPFRLAALLRRKLIFMTGLYLGGARYDVQFHELADFSERIADPGAREARIQAAVVAYAGLLESLCREHPYNWFNFHDFWREDEA